MNNLSEKTKEIVCKVLKIDRISQAIDMPFSQEDAERNETGIYNPLYRNIKLAAGRYYTKAEYEKWAAKIRILQLP